MRRLSQTHLAATALFWSTIFGSIGVTMYRIESTAASSRTSAEAQQAHAVQTAHAGHVAQASSSAPGALARCVPTRRAFAFGAAAGVLAATLPWRARAASNDPHVLLEQARAVIEDAKHDPQFGNSAELLRGARAVMIVPQLVKGGFFVGGEGGDGVMLSRVAGRAWGQPAFYVIGSASFGLQIGLEVAELVLFVMSGRAEQAFLKDEFKVGAEAGLTVLVVGTNAQAAMTGNASPDIIAWAKSKGAYAGITLEGSVVKPRTEWNASYYGRPVTAAQIVNGSVSASSSGANGLRAALQSG